MRRSIKIRSVHVAAILTAALAVISCAGEASAKTPKNVILMIADGAGFNAYRAGSMYEGKWDAAKGVGTQVYDGPGWVKYGCTTYPLTTSVTQTGTTDQDAKLVYQPGKAWGNSPLDGKKRFAGYGYVMSGATDSAAAGTALASGTKTYNNAINWTNTDRPLQGVTLPEIAKANGKAVGVVTTVPLSHATPACLGGAHNRDRDDYAGIANEMFGAPYLDVIMGAGHPEFDSNGKPKAAAKPAKDSAKPAGDSAKYVGGEATWKQLKAGTHPAGWKLIQTKQQFETLAKGEGFAGIKVLGVAQVADTLQQRRGKHQPTDKPFSQPMNENVPNLETMTRAALAVLDADPDGFLLTVEGGAVDWAAHANQPARVIEEQVDFNRAVQAVAAWVENRSNWDETLVIVTADHETGMLWGANSDSAAFDPVQDAGPGKMPGMKFHSTSHTNSLVPLHARGPGSEQFARLVDGKDEKAAAAWRFSGQYVDNTEVFAVIQAGLVGQPAAVAPAAAGQ